MTEQFPAADAAALRASAFALANQGRMLEAERAFSDLLRGSPGDADALNFLAVCAHGRGRADEAMELLLQARQANPGDAATLVNLGSLQRERERLDDAQAAFAEAVRLAPDIPAARLRLAEVLEARGSLRDALPMYFGAIMAAQKRNAWLSDETTEPALRPLVMHAMRVVDSGRRALFTGLLAPLREMHGDLALRRVGRCLATYLGELRPAYADPAQRPTFLYMPDLPSTRFFERDLFPWYGAMEAQTDAIRAEMQAVFTADGSGFEPFFGHFDDKNARIEDHLRNDRGDTPVWDAFFFYRHGVRYDANAVRCPITAAALDATPLCRIREHAPEVCFSVLTPGSHILPHRGVTNTRVVTHLPLVVPEGDLVLNVSGEPMHWHEGRCFSFDDTFEHEAWNRSDETRVVLLFDVWNPHLTPVERDALTTLIGGIGDFNRAAGL
ncbi:aspartyl/asparaginyl beta-hydroxylase domain-containing protein [Dokdonella sp.]|uniref:aspartyl/asparaginyl beta-hydroxylase domain-containing protein n=1 Tax=Dokdonella sp. TaxID=2291710 RepID=UPI003784EFCD